MVNNADCARAIARFAREKARSDGLAELVLLADRLKSLVAPAIAVQPRRGIKTATPASAGGTVSACRTEISARCMRRLR